MTQRHVIEILYAERCRFLPLAIARVRRALSLRDGCLDIEVRLVLVETFVEAVARGFHSSPTVRIDGREVVLSVVQIRHALDVLVAEERSRVRVRYTRPSTPPSALAAQPA